MSHPWIEPNQCQSLAVLVESVSAPLLIAHQSPVCLELEIVGGLPIPADPAITAELIRALVKQSLGEMPDGGDLMITACETANGIELEFADSGSSVDQRATRLPMAAAAIGAEVVWQDCPQGGAAATIHFRSQGNVGRQAA